MKIRPIDDIVEEEEALEKEELEAAMVEPETNTENNREKRPEPQIEMPSYDREKLALKIKGGYLMAGAMASQRFGVTALQPAESEMLANQTIEVLDCFPDFTPFDPRWDKYLACGTLLFMVYGVTAPRVQEYHAKKSMRDVSPGPKSDTDDDNDE